jgi:hypothetical protein
MGGQARTSTGDQFTARLEQACASGATSEACAQLESSLSVQFYECAKPESRQSRADCATIASDPKLVRASRWSIQGAPSESSASRASRMASRAAARTRTI